MKHLISINRITEGTRDGILNYEHYGYYYGNRNGNAVIHPDVTEKGFIPVGHMLASTVFNAKSYNDLPSAKRCAKHVDNLFCKNNTDGEFFTSVEVISPDGGKKTYTYAFSGNWEELK